MAEALRYLDTAEGEMHWSEPSAGAKTRKISYGEAGDKCYCIEFAEPRPTEAVPGATVTVDAKTVGSSYQAGGEYVGYTDGTVPSSYGDMRDCKSWLDDYSGARSFKYTFTMPDSDVTVWHYCAGGPSVLF